MLCRADRRVTQAGHPGERGNTRRHGARRSEPPNHDQGEEAQPGWQWQAKGEEVDALGCSREGLMASTGFYSHTICGHFEESGSTMVGYDMPQPYACGEGTYNTDLGAIRAWEQA